MRIEFPQAAEGKCFDAQGLVRARQGRPKSFGGGDGCFQAAFAKGGGKSSQCLGVAGAELEHQPCVGRGPDPRQQLKHSGLAPGGQLSTGELLAHHARHGISPDGADHAGQVSRMAEVQASGQELRFPFRCEGVDSL